MSEVTKELYDAGYEKGTAAERVNTEKEKNRAEKEKNRADLEKKRADAAEAEVLKLREELEVLRKQKHNSIYFKTIKKLSEDSFFYFLLAILISWYSCRSIPG